jgi:hypothetical protein
MPSVFCFLLKGFVRAYFVRFVMVFLFKSRGTCHGFVLILVWKV